MDIPAAAYELLIVDNGSADRRRVGVCDGRPARSAQARWRVRSGPFHVRRGPGPRVSIARRGISDWLFEGERRPSRSRAPAESLDASVHVLHGSKPNPRVRPKLSVETPVPDRGRPRSVRPHGNPRMAPIAAPAARRALARG